MNSLYVESNRDVKNHRITIVIKNYSAKSELAIFIQNTDLLELAILMLVTDVGD